MEEKTAPVIFTFYCPWCAKTTYVTASGFIITGKYHPKISCPGGCGHEYEYDVIVKTDPKAALLQFQEKMKTRCVFDKFAYRLKGESVSLLMANVKKNKTASGTEQEQQDFKLGYRWMHGGIAYAVFSLYKISPEFKKNRPSPRILVRDVHLPNPTDAIG